MTKKKLFDHWDDIIQNNGLEIPNYIKLDVGSFELEILEGFGHFLKNPKIKSLVTEMKFSSKKVGKFTFDEEKLKEKSNKIYDILLKSGFKSHHLENSLQRQRDDSRVFALVVPHHGPCFPRTSLAVCKDGRVVPRHGFLHHILCDQLVRVFVGAVWSHDPIKRTGFRARTGVLNDRVVVILPPYLPPAVFQLPGHKRAQANVHFYRHSFCVSHGCVTIGLLCFKIQRKFLLVHAPPFFLFVIFFPIFVCIVVSLKTCIGESIIHLNIKIIQHNNNPRRRRKKKERRRKKKKEDIIFNNYNN